MKTSYRDLRQQPGFNDGAYGCSEYVDATHDSTCSKRAFIVPDDYEGAWCGDAYCDEHDPRKAVTA